MNMDVAATRPLVSVLWHWQLDDSKYIPPLKPVQLIPRSSSRIGTGRLVHTHTSVKRPFVRDYPGEPVPERRNQSGFYWNETVSGSGISWAICKSAPLSRQITTPAPHRSVFLQAGCPSCRPTNSVKALKARSTEGESTEGRLVLIGNYLTQIHLGKWPLNEVVLVCINFNGFAVGWELALESQHGSQGWFCLAEFCASTFFQYDILAFPMQWHSTCCVE